MNIATETSERGTNGMSNAFRRGFQPVRETAGEAIEYGERVVANHPETAVFSSLFVGLLIGGLAGFLLGDFRQQNSWKRDLRSLLGKLQGRMSDLI